MKDSKFIAYVESAQQGNQIAFAKIYDQTYKHTKIIVQSIIKNPSDVDDLIQDSYIKMLVALPNLKDVTKFKSWFNRIITNTCKDYLIKKRPTLFAECEDDDYNGSFEDTLEDTSTTASIEKVAESKQVSKRIKECIEQLPEDQRICIIMHYYCEMTADEIASVLEVSRNTVLSRLSYGRKKLKKALEKDKKEKMFGFVLFPFVQNSLERTSDRPFFVKGKAKSFNCILKSAEAQNAFGHVSVATKALSMLQVTKKAVIATVVSVGVATSATTVAVTQFNNSQQLPEAPPAISTPVDQPEPVDKTISYGSKAIQVNGCIVYCSNNAVYFSADNFATSAKIADGNALNFVQLGDDVLFAVNGSICSFNTTTQLLSVLTQADVDYVFCYDNVYALDASTATVYAFDSSYAVSSASNLNGENIAVDKDRIFYYDSSSQSVMTCYPYDVNGAQRIVKSNKYGFKVAYQIRDNYCIYPDFDSDETGKLNVYNIETQKTDTIKLEKPFIDFAMTDTGFVYTNYDFGVYSCGSRGENPQQIYTNQLSCIGSCANYVALYNSFVDTTLIFNTTTGAFEYVINQRVSHFEIFGDYVFYTSGGITTATALSKLTAYGG